MVISIIAEHIEKHSTVSHLLCVTVTPIDFYATRSAIEKKTIQELSFPFYSRVRAVVARRAGCSWRIGLPTVPGEQAGGTVRVVVEGVELEQGTAAREEVQPKQGRRTRLFCAVQEHTVRRGGSVDLRGTFDARRYPTHGTRGDCQPPAHRYAAAALIKK